ncbi:hypothetical protein [Mesobacillus selenatarsenatis]|uniref:Uncharacterized protein n=1 Tax=Mesobacillus selenatarsenatis TaxID=388741 RepID=A0A846TJT0_9BACI|nr:hypothetical protein [Mesobacillus selenatarsenatis]NKE07029.1 hypothetical protein [Mesobacillus selenatarsenatis]
MFNIEPETKETNIRCPRCGSRLLETSQSDNLYCPSCEDEIDASDFLD